MVQAAVVTCASRKRMGVIGLVARYQQLRRVRELDDGERARLAPIIDCCDPEELAMMSTVTDQEIGKARQVITAKFKDIYPAGI